MPKVSVHRDLRPKFGPARDQGARPTCLAFAASDCHSATRGDPTALSVEYVFYQAQRRGGCAPSVGATLTNMLDALREDGQPVEADWPYLPSVPDKSKWLPPKTLGAIYRRHGEKRGHDFGEIISLLDADYVPLVLLTISDSFYLPDAEGLVVPISGEGPDPTRRHATVAVAHGSLAKERVVLVRNSWGPAWGLDGYAWLPESFLGPRLARVAILTGQPHVSSH